MHLFGRPEARSAQGDTQRILLASRSGQLGGMELRMVDEARCLSKMSYETLLAVSAFPGRDLWLNQVLADNPHFYRLDFDPPPFFEEWQWRRFNLMRGRIFWPSRLRRAAIDLAHIFYAWTYEGGTRLWLCHQAGIPTVLSIHNSFPTATMTPWHAKRTAEAFSSVRGLYAVSDSALGHFLNTYGRFVRDDAVVRSIPNFVDVSRFVPSPKIRAEVRAELGIPEEAKVLGSIGRLDTQKRPDHVLEVFDRLWATRKDIYLVFCGQGPLENDVRIAATQQPWADRVRFLGFRRDVERIFPALDVHLLLSKQEGFGISTVEAMACAVPVVATDVPGTRDILSYCDGGQLVPYGDFSAASTLTAAYLDSADLQRTAGSAGRRVAEDKYSMDTWRHAIQEFYDSVMHRQ